MSKLRYGVIYWRGRTLKFKSFIRLDQAKVFFDLELRERRDCRMLEYDASKTPMKKVRQRMIAHETAHETWDNKCFRLELPKHGVIDEGEEAYAEHTNPYGFQDPFPT